MNIFYEPNIKQTHLLNEEESRHAIRVLRLTVGSKIYVVDGYGGFYGCDIKVAHEKKCEVRILEEQQNYEHQDFYIHLIIAPTKNMDRIEWMVEKCVEMGIHEISFIQSRYSERKEIKIARIEKIAIGAMKQSLKAFLPKINEMISWKAFLQKDIAEDQKMIAHLEEGDRKLIQELATKKGNYAVMIGPEGDFTPEEIQQALAKGFKPITLGKSRLRTETAGLAACFALNLINQ
ncbi:16S rRNA (uracil(1498)-N(3))-methyltransferase [Arcicella aquatica]|uniref:Ribosomal RNA small subunit methyltransferase E n=1 Tax=Arcicella aquatica TaxID=217141 RepID=A0ABU5QK77_9BACT|nr:16S rRNA (uracil(1498)-N(3))-methyltransferase [Arcicella aquatica]MEA5257234.1 16S rRNA (uracil(1498)-N(3))-methyltransferase [Arcicella aquatica]